MKVALVNPSMKNSMKTCSNYIPMNAVNHFVPINLLYLGTVLKQKTVHDVKIIDADIDGKDYEEVAEEIKKENADIVGISAITFTFYDCLETIRAIKRVSPNVIVCVGGPLVKDFSKEAIMHPEIDYVLVGEAEYTFVELVEAIEKNHSPQTITGLLYKENGKIISTGAPETIKNLDDLPFPSLTLIDHKKYYFSMGNSKPLATILGSRGCPYQCRFCQSANTGYRMRSIKNMLDEIKNYVDYGITNFNISDDTFNISANRVIEFSKGILERGYKITWNFRGRIEKVSEEMFQVAKKSGLILMSFGVEDATNEALEIIKRKQTLDQVFKGVALAKKCKIPISTNFILGLPTQKTEEDIFRVITLAKKLQPEYCQFSVFVPHYGTGFYEEGVANGILNPNFWSGYIKNPVKEAYIPNWGEYFTQEELDRFMKKAHCSFYFDPKYMLQALSRVENLGDFFVKAGVALNIFTLFVLGKRVVESN